MGGIAGSWLVYEIVIEILYPYLLSAVDLHFESMVDDDFEEVESEDLSPKINEVKLESKSEESINKLQQFSFKKLKSKQ